MRLWTRLIDPRRRLPRWRALVLGLSLPTLVLAAQDFDRERAQMVAEIEADVRLTAEQLGRGTLAPGLVRALKAVPRHEFVPAEQRRYAYENRPLPIGYGQTISQPYIVAAMTELLQLAPESVVFELGTGSGYQAAVLAQLAQRVYTMEIVPELGERAQAALGRLGYHNVSVRVGDGYYGWEQHAPFDGILVTAAGDHIPPSLLRQLKPGGRMVIPVGSQFLTQQLLLVEKDADGGIHTREVLTVSFVPLTGDH